MASKPFEFHEQLMIDTSLVQLTQFEKIGNSVYKTPKHPITFFVTFILLLFGSGFCFPFNKRNELNLKRNQKSNRKKNKFEPAFLFLLPKEIVDFAFLLTKKMN